MHLSRDGFGAELGTDPRTCTSIGRRNIWADSGAGFGAELGGE